MGWQDVVIQAAASGAGDVFGSLFNANQAEVARHYNTRMANTAHQREVADLLAAGLNPMLSYGGSGAPSPSSPTAQKGSSNLGESITNARRLSEVDKKRVENETRLVDKDLEKRDAEIGLVNAQKELTHNSAVKVARELPLMELENEFWRTLAPVGREALRAIAKRAKDLKIPDTGDVVEEVKGRLTSPVVNRIEEFEARGRDAKRAVERVIRGLLTPAGEEFWLGKDKSRRGASGRW